MNVRRPPQRATDLLRYRKNTARWEPVFLIVLTRRVPASIEPLTMCIV